MRPTKILLLLVLFPSLASGGTAVETTAIGPLGAVECMDETDFCVIEDFPAGTGTSTTMGTHGWSFVGGTAAVQAAELNHNGIVQRATSASAGTFAWTALGSTTQAPLPMGTSTLTWIVRINHTDADTTARCGLMNVFAGNPTAGQYFERLGSDTNWFAVTQHASSPTRADTGVAASTDWIKFRIERIGNAQVLFSINGLPVATITETITSTASYMGCQITNGGASASKTMDLDYAKIRIPMTR